MPASVLAGVMLFALLASGGCSGAERTSHPGEETASAAGAAETARVPAPIVIDGRFDDWASVPAVSSGGAALHSSAAGAGAAA
ncbi:MAG: hypothetical protein ACE5HQ_13500, partial [Gemmatimonadota bacterium]